VWPCPPLLRCKRTQDRKGNVTETGPSGWPGVVGLRHGSALLPPTSLPAADHPAAIWLYLRFTLSYRDVEEVLAERGLEVSYEPFASTQITDSRPGQSPSALRRAA
jgi:hypothetical protein